MNVGDFDLYGKIAVVTGGGSGINLSFSRMAAAAGAKVLIADLKLTTEGSEFLETAGASVVFTRCDVSKRADLENLISVSKREFGDVPDVYIAGAGVFDPEWSNFWDDTEGDDYAQVAINVTHALKLTRIAIRALLSKNKKGVVLVVSSLAGYQGTYSAPLYCATKHAVIGFVRSMADLDTLEGIKVVAVAPGLVRTPLWTDYPEKMARFGYTLENTITADTVASVMTSLVTSGKYGGGTCLESSAAGARELGTWNIAPPDENGTKVPEEFLVLNREPITKMLAAERKQC